MKLAFVLYKYFPYGGLQRDMLKIAKACQQRGHEVHIYTLSWTGDLPEGIEIHIVPVHRLMNHARYRAFSRALQPLLHDRQIDRVVGFNKMPGLDYYYAADPCLKDKLCQKSHRLIRWLPRYRHFMSYEEAVFGVDSTTEIMLLAPRQKEIYQNWYRTPEQRLHMLPPGISRDRMAPGNAAEIRSELRREFSLTDDEYLVLCIGSGFKTKGLDRSLRAVAALPAALKERTRLIAIGSDHGESFQLLAKRLGVAGQFEILQGRDDIPRFLQGGDLLLHPAYHENSGMVILEGVIAGLPVLVTDVCGYAYHVEQADAGRVVPSPFDQQQLNRMLAEMLVSASHEQWSKNGIAYGKENDLYSMAEVASDLILGSGTT